VRFFLGTVLRKRISPEELMQLARMHLEEMELLRAQAPLTGAGVYERKVVSKMV
jgi:hypothetical protein